MRVSKSLSTEKVLMPLMSMEVAQLSVTMPLSSDVPRGFSRMETAWQHDEIILGGCIIIFTLVALSSSSSSDGWGCLATTYVSRVKMTGSGTKSFVDT